MAAETNSKKESSAPVKRNFSIIDFFEDLGAWAENNATKLVVGFTGVVVACIFAVAVSIYQNSVAQKHFTEAFNIEQQFTSLMTAPELANNPDSSPMMMPLTPEKLEEIQPQILTYVKSHPKSDAARNLAIKWVSKLYDMKHYDKAAEVMNELQPNTKSSLSGLALLLKGSTLMEAGQTPEAIEVFREILKHKNWTYVHPEASYQLSMAQLKNNDPDAAILSLKTIHDEYSDKKAELSSQATKVMRWLQYQKAQKSAASAVEAAAN